MQAIGDKNRSTQKRRRSATKTDQRKNAGDRRQKQINAKTQAIGDKNRSTQKRRRSATKTDQRKNAGDRRQKQINAKTQAIGDKNRSTLKRRRLATKTDQRKNAGDRRQKQINAKTQAIGDSALTYAKFVFLHCQHKTGENAEKSKQFETFRLRFGVFYALYLRRPKILTNSLITFIAFPCSCGPQNQ